MAEENTKLLFISLGILVSRLCSTALSSLLTSKQQLYKIFDRQKQKCGKSIRTMMSLS